MTGPLLHFPVNIQDFRPFHTHSHRFCFSLYTASHTHTASTVISPVNTAGWISADRSQCGHGHWCFLIVACFYPAAPWRFVLSPH